MTSIHLLLSVAALSPPTGDIRENISLNAVTEEKQEYVYFLFTCCSWSVPVKRV